MATFKIRDKKTGKVFTIREKEPQRREAKRPTLFPEVEEEGAFLPTRRSRIGAFFTGQEAGEQLAPGERTVFGELKDRPASAIRAAIQADPGTRLEAFARGAIRPESIPAPSQLPSGTSRLDAAIGESVLMASPGGMFLARAVNEQQKSRLGSTINKAVQDFATDPFEQLLTLTTGGPVTRGIGRGLEATTRGLGKFVSKFKIDFVNENLFPRVAKIFNESVEKITPAIQRFIRKDTRNPKILTDHLSSRGAVKVRETRAAFEDSLDNVAQGIKKGFDQKDELINQSYTKALNSIADNDLIPIDDAFKEVTKVLERNGIIDKIGNVTSFAKSPTIDPKLRALSDLYDFLVPIKGAGTTRAQRVNIGGINKAKWQQLRTALSKTSVRTGKSQLTKDVVKISDKLHDQAEQAGVSGISQARKLQAEFFQKSELLSKIDDEKKLTGFFKSTESRRNLTEVDQYLKSDFSNATKDIISGRELQKVIDDAGRLSADTRESILKTRLKSAVNPRETESIKRSFFEDLLGKSNELDDIFNDLKGFRRNQIIKTGLKRAGAAALVTGGGIAGLRAGARSFGGGGSE